MSAVTHTMTEEQRVALAIEYLKSIDNGGTRPSRGSILELFDEDAQVYFPKWGLANGIDEIGRLFADLGETLTSITHDDATINWISSGTDTIVAEGTSNGVHRDGPWRAGEPEWAAGRWCDVFDIRNGKIHRCFIYLDPDYAGADTDRYPWLKNASTQKEDE